MYLPTLTTNDSLRPTISPEVLTPEYELVKPNILKFHFTGAAFPHKDDITNLSFGFANQLIKDYKLVRPIENIEDKTLDFVSEVALIIGDNFVEQMNDTVTPANNNRGYMDGARTITITDDDLAARFRFGGVLDETAFNTTLQPLLSITNLPSGLTPEYSRPNSALITNQIVITLTGNTTEVAGDAAATAAKHHYDKTVNNLQFRFDADIFSSGVGGQISTRLIFQEPIEATIKPTDSFTEVRADGTVIDGRIANILTLDIYNTVLSSSITNDTLKTGNFIEILDRATSNPIALPTGLDVKYTILPTPFLYLSRANRCSQWSHR